VAKTAARLVTQPACARPRRLRVEGDLFHPRVPDGAVYVGRGGRGGLVASPYANPHTVGAGKTGHGCRACGGAAHPTKVEAVELYRRQLRERPQVVAAVRRDLAGRDLACWCRLDEPCHGDILLAVAAGADP
jgi:uncharacterized protein DUF4326